MSPKRKTAGQKAAQTRKRSDAKRRAVGEKAALTRKRRAAAKKAVATHKHRAAGVKTAKTSGRRAAARKTAATRAQKKQPALTPPIELSARPTETVTAAPKAESTQLEATPSDNVNVQKSA